MSSEKEEIAIGDTIHVKGHSEEYQVIDALYDNTRYVINPNGNFIFAWGAELVRKGK